MQTLTCANCGAALATSASPGTELTCDYCGTALRVPAAGTSGAAADGPAGVPAFSEVAPPDSDHLVTRPSPAAEPHPEPEPIVVPPERITVIPAGGRAWNWSNQGNRARLSLGLALMVLLCCGLPLATTLLCLATGLGGDLNLR